MKWKSILLVVSVALLGCSRPDGRSVSAAYVPSGYYLPFLVVEEQGLLAKHGYTFNLQRFNSNSDMINAFVNGKLDVTAQSSLTMFPVEEKYPGLFKYVYGQYNESYSFVVPLDSQLHSIQDLKNKSILTWQSPTAEACVNILMSKFDIGSQDYKLTRVGAGDVAGQMARGGYDATFLFDVPAQYLVSTGKFRYLARSAMKDVLTTSTKQVPIFNGGAFIASRIIVDNPSKAYAIRDSLLEAVDFIVRDPNAARQILAKRLQVRPEVAGEAALDLFHRPDGNTISSAEATLDLLRTNGLVTKNAKINVQSLFWLPSK